MTYHLPVMVHEILEYMIVNPEGRYVDCTLGGGGHSESFLKRLGGKGQVTSFDRDPDAIAHATERLKQFGNFNCHNIPFSAIGSVLEDESVDGILYDLGVSSYQLDNADRGFTFREEKVLDMRMNQTDGQSANEYLLAVSEEELARILKKNGDLQKSRRIAAAIKNEINNKAELYPADIKAIVTLVFKGQQKKHIDIMARIFQSIRMEINEELHQIEESFSALERVMKKGGRVCVLSYHSGEDRLVKNIMRDKEQQCICPKELPLCMCGGNNRTFKKVFNKPLLPTDEEIKANSRARSAKLRVYERV